MPHRRVHQYRGGHDETYGGVTINIDRSWVDLGRGSWVRRERPHCRGAARYDYRRYAARRVGDHGALVATIQCLLQGRGLYDGRIDGRYDQRLAAAVSRFRVRQGISAKTVTGRTTWVALLSHGHARVLKTGSASVAVRRLQRALNAADSADLAVTGVFDVPTRRAVKRYQRDHRLARTGVVTGGMWHLLHAGQA
jgi:peptidoglycan hydrolase-like protein with peptidoglycan-binding domain